MSLQIVTGQPRAMKPFFYGALKRALEEPGDGPLIVLVPEQYTLVSERDILAAMGLSGSFRLQVMSTARLIRRLFQACGAPDETRVDERGRVMLMHAALRDATDELEWYRGAQRMMGFAEKAAAQVKELKQAGLRADTLRALADRLQGPVAKKARDLSKVWERYDAALVGRYIDGEDELIRALPLIDRADFLDGARIFLSGYELISPTQAQLGAALALRHEVTWLIPAVTDEKAPDAAVWQPVLKRLWRFEAIARSLGVECRRVEARDVSRDSRPEDLRHLVSQINSIPPRAFGRPAPSVELWLRRNPYDEAQAAMADIRRRVMEGGMRYRDAAIVCWDLKGMADPLERAAALYGVPMFLSEGRGADRSPLCRYALTALRLIDGYAADDMDALMRTGYTALTDDECDMMCDTAVEEGLRGALWKKPLSRGGDDKAEWNARCEPLRRRLMEPLIAFEEAFRAAKDTRGQLEALWGLLERSGAYERLQAEQEECARAGLSEAANENAQAWNRLLGTMDQLCELMAGSRLTARELYDMLRQALAASDIRPLPQSGDAVMVGSMSHLRSGAVARLYVLGCNERGIDREGSLLEAHERAALQAVSDIWLAPDQSERTSLSALDLATTLSMAQQGVTLSWSSSDQGGGALQPSPVISRVKHILKDIPTRLSGDEGAEKALLCAPDAALARLGPAISGHALPQGGEGVLSALRDWAASQPGLPDPIASFGQAAMDKLASGDMPRDTARALYHGLNHLSVSRLETYARCPFSYFVTYGLRPDTLKPYELGMDKLGTFYHDALQRFVSGVPKIAGLTADEAAQRMDDVSQPLIRELMDGPLSDNPVVMNYSRRMCAIARRAAGMVVRHLSGSRFEPAGTEIEFSVDRGNTIALSTSEGDIPLTGRIDRVDCFEENGKRYYRVIDYKSGSTKLSLGQLYAGLQLQLMIYMAVCIKNGGEPAGAFYFHVADPYIDTQSRDPEAVEKDRVAKLRLDGVYLSDDKIVSAMAEHPEDVIPTRVRYAGLSEDDFSLLIDHVIRKATELAESILSGRTEINPVQVGQRLPCEYCDARAACHRDPQLTTHRTDSIDNGAVLSTLRAERAARAEKAAAE